MELPTVSVLVAAGDDSAQLLQTLDSLFAQTLAPCEILVLDRGAATAVSAALQGLGDAVQTLSVSVAPGTSRLAHYDQALSRVRGAHVALFAAGNLYHPELLARQAALLAGDAGLGAVFCRTVTVDLHNQALGQPVLPDAFRAGRVLGFDAVLDALLRDGPDALRAETAMVPTAVVRELGGFSEARFADGADADLWLRVARLRKLTVIDEPLVRSRAAAPGRVVRGEGYYRALDHHMDEGAVDPTALRRHLAREQEDRLLRALSRYADGDRAAAADLMAGAAVAPLLHPAQGRTRRAALYGLARGLLSLPASEPLRRVARRRLSGRRQALPWLNW